MGPHSHSGVAWRTLHNSSSATPALIVPSILFPLFFFTAFAGGLSTISNVPGFDYPGGYTAFQFVFVLLQSAAFGGVFTGFGIARDFEMRLRSAAPTAARLTQPLRDRARLRARGGDALRSPGRCSPLIALVVGMDVGGNAVDIVGLYTLALLVNICGFDWSAGIAMRLRTIQAGPLMQLPVFLTLFLAPVYVPLDLLSGAIHVTVA